MARRVLPLRLRSDLGSLARYGPHAPFAYQRIWFDPQICTKRTRDEVFESYTYSGSIVGGDWDLEATPVEEHPVLRFCRLHWEQEVPWEETGVYDWLLERIERSGDEVDGCRTREDVIARYERLDRLFEEVRYRGRLLTQSELRTRHERERGGIRVCVGRDGEPIFSWSGHHRLAIARIVGLREVPGQLHVVHPRALTIWRERYSPTPRLPGWRRVRRPPAPRRIRSPRTSSPAAMTSSRSPRTKGTTPTC